MSLSVPEWLDTVTKVSEFAPLIALATAAFRYGKFSSAQRFFFRVLLIIFVNQMVAKALYEWFQFSNLPLYHIYLIIEGVGMLGLFRYRFSKPTKKWLAWAMVGFVVLTLANAFWWQGWKQLPSYTRSLEAILMAGLSLYYFRHVFVEGQVKRLDNSFWFWVSAGLLLYFSCNLMLFIFTNSLTNREDQLFLGVWAIHAGLNFLLYGFYAVAFLCQDQESSYSS